jgi:hypothetical protein
VQATLDAARKGDLQLIPRSAENRESVRV